MLTSLALTEKLSQFVENVTKPIKEVSSRISKKEDNSAQRFLTWASKSGSATLATWLNNLSEEALVGLIREASAFCTQFGIDMAKCRCAKVLPDDAYEL